MKKTRLALALIFTLSFTLVAEMHVVEASSQSGFPFTSGIFIQSPANRTYTCSLLTLNVSISGLGGSNIDVSMVYSLDGKNNVTIPITAHSRQNSFVVSYTEFVTLPKLPYGSHRVTVHSEYNIYNASQNGVLVPKDARLDSNTVYFTISDKIPKEETIPPVISNLSLENRTYNSVEMPLTLSFNIDKTVTWLAYCLDNQAIITIAGWYDPDMWGTQFNATLTGVSDGAHSLIVYANDTFGNTGVSDIVWFTVEPVSSSHKMPASSQSLATSPNQPHAFYPDLVYALAVVIVALVILAVALALRKPLAEQA